MNIYFACVTNVSTRIPILNLPHFLTAKFASRVFLVNPLHPTLSIFPPLLKSLQPFLSEIEDMEWSFWRVKRMNVTATGMGQGSFTHLLAADCWIDLIDSYISQSLVITGAQPKAGTGHKMQTVSFFQRYIVRDIWLTEIYRWLIEILSAILKSTRHGGQSRKIIAFSNL